MGRYRSPNVNPALGPVLRQAREHAQKTPQQAAERVGVTTDTIDAWEEGRTEPRASQLLILGLFYETAPSSLFKALDQIAA